MEPTDRGGGVGVAGLDQVALVGVAAEGDDDFVVAAVDGGAGVHDLLYEAGLLGGAEAFADTRG